MKPRSGLSCKAKALSWLSRREYSQREMMDKLSHAGYSSQDIDAVIHWLASKNWQSDERFAQNLARRRAHHYGKRYIEAELKKHDIGGTSVRDALNTLESEQMRAFQWLMKRYGCLKHSMAAADFEAADTPAAILHNLKAKMFRSLSNRGFENHDIQQAIKKWEQANFFESAQEFNSQ